MGVLVKAEDLVKDFPVRGHLLDSLFSRQRFVHAIDHVDIAIEEGKVVGLVGESGSGKSTLGRMLARLIEPTSGTIWFRDKNILAFTKKEVEVLRQSIQVIFQDPVSSLSPRMSVGNAIGHPLVIHKKGNSAERRQTVLEIMGKVGLSPAEYLYKKYPHQLSGGQSQRVVIARALVTNPAFIIADEPIAMADVSVRALILQLMKQLKDELGLTYLFITHDLSTAKYLCDDILVMYLGRIVEKGDRKQLFSQPHHPYTQALLAAVPIPEPDARVRENLPAGEIPSAINPPSGCHFHPRCPFRQTVCSEARPPLKEVSPGHFSACVLPVQQ